MEGGWKAQQGSPQLLAVVALSSQPPCRHEGTRELARAGSRAMGQPGSHRAGRVTEDSFGIKVRKETQCWRGSEPTGRSSCGMLLKSDGTTTVCIYGQFDLSASFIATSSLCWEAARCWGLAPLPVFGKKWAEDAVGAQRGKAGAAGPSAPALGLRALCPHMGLRCCEQR